MRDGPKAKTPAEGEGLDGTASTRRTAVPPRSPPETGGADGGPSRDRSCRPWGRKSTTRRLQLKAASRRALAGSELKQRATASRAIADLDVPPQAAGQVGRGVLAGALADLGLVGDAGVLDAVDAFRGAAAAEAELAGRGVADRPFAHVGAQRQHGGGAGQFGRGSRSGRLGRGGDGARRGGLDAARRRGGLRRRGRG